MLLEFVFSARGLGTATNVLHIGHSAGKLWEATAAPGLVFLLLVVSR